MIGKAVSLYSPTNVLLKRFTPDELRTSVSLASLVPDVPALEALIELNGGRDVRISSQNNYLGLFVDGGIGEFIPPGRRKNIFVSKESGTFRFKDSHFSVSHEAERR